MTVTVFHAEPEPQGGYQPDTPLAYYFDADSMTLRKADHPDVVAFLAGGGTIQPYQTPPPPPTTSEIDQDRLNTALAADGSVVRALGLVMFAEINKLRLKGGDPAYTLNQFKAALKAQMRT